jgi:hypothetical protein
MTDVDAFLGNARTWVEFTTHLLKTLFTTEEEANIFSARVRLSFTMNPVLDDLVREKQEDVREYLRRLASLQQRLPFYRESAASSSNQR